MELSKAYNPKNVEERIYKLWLKSGFFNPDNLPGKRKKTYTLVLPPPNVTGSLHMGHALNATVQDILIRQKRMQGYSALWLPGTDHAGIATQNVVEKELKKQGKTRFDLGKEKLIKRIWQWKEKYGDIILNQFKRLGSSCDWSRARFTMDKDYAKAVKTTFLHYYKKNWIYKGKRVVNWCSRCQTSLSDLELDYKEEKGKLYYIRYPLSEKRKFIVVATTRPETMLGDTAIAVNPKDKRYKKLVGEKAILPIVNQEIPIVKDFLVDPKFGTGAVKITPAHDSTDYQISLNHNLKMNQVIDENTKMMGNIPERFLGLSTLEARKLIIKELKKQGLVKEIKPYTHRVPYCYRCKTKIENIPSEQWFLKMDKLADIARKQVKQGKIKFVPKRFEKIYFDWLENIRDWCISRQIWWGHQIPIWYCENTEKKIKNTTLKMGFAGDVVPQVFDNKTRTYRLRNHVLKVKDKVAFENSVTDEIFGTAIITEVQKTTVGKIDLKDKKHWKTYNKLEDLITAFQRHHPKKEINTDTLVWIYTYKFRRVCPPIMDDKYAFKKCPVCNGEKLRQETDVLDTWFSSALWPFATLGWPKKTKDLKRFYPTNVLSTARHIINFWVLRMIFSGMEFMKKPPFTTIYIHPTVLAEDGTKMSKSIGNVIDPIDLIDKYGADATRFGIIWGVTKGQDMRFVDDNIIMGKKFCNKIWNATRFVLMQTQSEKNKAQNYSLKPKIQNLTLADKKILKALDKTIKTVNKNFDNFEFGKTTHLLYDFFWHDFCDKYLEISKSQIVNSKSEKERKNTIKTLLYVLITSLKLLHPFIPFITEEIYQILPIKNKQKSLMIETWPL